MGLFLQSHTWIHGFILTKITGEKLTIIRNLFQKQMADYSPNHFGETTIPPNQNETKISAEKKSVDTYYLRKNFFFKVRGKFKKTFKAKLL